MEGGSINQAFILTCPPDYQTVEGETDEDHYSTSLVPKVQMALDTSESNAILQNQVPNLSKI